MWTRWHTFHQRVASGGQAINASQMPEQMKVTMEKMKEVQNQRKRSDVKKAAESNGGYEKVNP